MSQPPPKNVVHFRGGQKTKFHPVDQSGGVSIWTFLHSTSPEISVCCCCFCCCCCCCCCHVVVTHQSFDGFKLKTANLCVVVELESETANHFLLIVAYFFLRQTIPEFFIKVLRLNPIKLIKLKNYRKNDLTWRLIIANESDVYKNVLVLHSNIITETVLSILYRVLPDYTSREGNIDPKILLKSTAKTRSQTNYIYRRFKN